MDRDWYETIKSVSIVESNVKIPVLARVLCPFLSCIYTKIVNPTWKKLKNLDAHDHLRAVD